jgi:hypothetical protein
MRYVLTIIVFLIASQSIAADNFREWTDVKGKKITAEFVKLENDSVTLRNKAGKEATFNTKAFSDADQKFIQREDARIKRVEEARLKREEEQKKREEERRIKEEESERKRLIDEFNKTIVDHSKNMERYSLITSTAYTNEEYGVIRVVKPEDMVLKDIELIRHGGEYASNNALGLVQRYKLRRYDDEVYLAMLNVKNNGSKAIKDFKFLITVKDPNRSVPYGSFEVLGKAEGGIEQGEIHSVLCFGIVGNSVLRMPTDKTMREKVVIQISILEYKTYDDDVISNTTMLD